MYTTDSLRTTWPDVDVAICFISSSRNVPADNPVKHLFIYDTTNKNSLNLPPSLPPHLTARQRHSFSFNGAKNPLPRKKKMTGICFAISRLGQRQTLARRALRPRNWVGGGSQACPPTSAVGICRSCAGHFLTRDGGKVKGRQKNNGRKRTRREWKDRAEERDDSVFLFFFFEGKEERGNNEIEEWKCNGER